MVWDVVARQDLVPGTEEEINDRLRFSFGRLFVPTFVRPDLINWSFLALTSFIIASLLLSLYSYLILAIFEDVLLLF